MAAVVLCIREIFPDSSVRTIRTERTHNANVTILVSNEFGPPSPSSSPAGSFEVWSGRQATLYLRYPKRRRRVMKKIKANLADLRDELQL